MDGGGYGGMYGDDGGAAAETYDKVVEFFGIIYIYNPVDKVKLKTEDSEESGDGGEAAADAAEVASVGMSRG